jgi:hypothetical protein
MAARRLALVILPWTALEITSNVFPLPTPRCIADVLQNPIDAWAAGP